MKKINFFVLFALIIGIAFTAPVHAEDTDCPTLASGDIFKVTGHTAVYLLDDNLNRLYFPNSEVFHSWYENFLEVVEISETCVSNYPAPLDPPFGVNYRAGSRLVKVKNKIRKTGMRNDQRDAIRE